MIELMPGGPDIDTVAILVAISGQRSVTLNRTEKLVAAAFVLAGGGGQADVVARCGISQPQASRLAAKIRATVGRAELIEPRRWSERDHVA